MTPALQLTLETFLAYYEQHGIAPTIQELAVLLGRRSKSGTCHHLQELVKRGFLVRMEGQARSLRPRRVDLRSATTSELRNELARRESAHG